MKPIEILREVRKHTDEIILFHSIGGKDSIYLLDACSKTFTHVYCVFMYLIQGLEHMERYKKFFLSSYDNCSFHEVEHYTLSTYRKIGFLGMEVNEDEKLNSFSKIIKFTRAAIGLDWVCVGSKQSDGLSRRLQLRTYEHNAIDWKDKKVYPLSDLLNKHVLQYIRENDLLEPLAYGDGKRSQSNNPTDPYFLTWCKKNYLNDWEKIKKMLPETEIIQFRHENKGDLSK